MFLRLLLSCVLVAGIFVPARAGDDCGIGYDNFSFAREHRLEKPFHENPREMWGAQQETIPYGGGMQACRRDQAWTERRVVSSANYWIQQKFNYCHHHLPTWTPTFPHGFGYPKPNDAERPEVCNYSPAPTGEAIRWNYSGSGDETADAWMHRTRDGMRGRFGNGSDCSNFTALVYNWGFGIRFSSDVSWQAGQDTRDPAQREVAPNMPSFRERSDVGGPDTGAAGKLVCGDGSVDGGDRCASHGGYISVFDASGKFNPDALTDAMLAQLRPGDLLFIAGSAGRSRHVTHVVIWIGQKVGDGVIANQQIAPQTDVHYQYGGCSRDVWKPENNVGTYVIMDSHYQGPDYRAFTGCFYRSQVWGVRRVLQ